VDEINNLEKKTYVVDIRKVSNKDNLRKMVQMGYNAIFVDVLRKNTEVIHNVIREETDVIRTCLEIPQDVFEGLVKKLAEELLEEVFDKAVDEAIDKLKEKNLPLKCEIFALILAETLSLCKLRNSIAYTMVAYNEKLMDEVMKEEKSLKEL